MVFLATSEFGISISAVLKFAGSQGLTSLRSVDWACGTEDHPNFLMVSAEWSAGLVSAMAETRRTELRIVAAAKSFMLVNGKGDVISVDLALEDCTLILLRVEYFFQRVSCPLLYT
jgi:hypothetical protein